jgi:superfamily II DNA or RNA helicase
MSERRRLSRADREAVFLRSNGHCEHEGCSSPITLVSFHVAHLRAQAHGGPTVLENVAAWCARCNWAQGARDVRDTRVVPRAWQLEALPVIVERIAQTGAATVAAAPGAGKTVLAGLAFEMLREADVVDRLVVLTPRRTLVAQWHDALYHQRHVELRSGHEMELPGQAGVVVTYQSLNATTLDVHRRLAARDRTLVVLDEVHHVGERDDAGQRPAWARYVMELVGQVDCSLQVAGVLNLSGTLWRSNTGERISTVRYVEEGGRLLSVVDHEVTAQLLIREGQLRPVDLYRRAATVELINLAEASRIVSPIADLTERPGRAAIRALPSDQAWRESFVAAILDRLERVHRDLGNGPAKALIVAPSQADARAFQETANRLMRARHLQPITELAVSSEGPSAWTTLERFRRSRRPGVLCTVDMAGEGYDCPDIAVIGFASNKLTPLYVRQVVARAQRVTDYERQTIGRPIPAAVVIPDVPELVELMSAILQPMRHEIDPAAAQPTREASGGGDHWDRRYHLDDVTDLADGDAYVTGTSDGNVAMDLIRAVEPHMHRVGLPVSETARMIYAVRSGMRDRREQRPFDALARPDADLAASVDVPASHRPMSEGPLSIERTAGMLRAELARLERWWHQIAGHATGRPIEHFSTDCNQAGGIARGGRKNANPDQLRVALQYARDQIAAFCEQSGKAGPRGMQDAG